MENGVNGQRGALVVLHVEKVIDQERDTATTRHQNMAGRTVQETNSRLTTVH